MNIPANLLYTSTHEWLRDEGDGTYTIGITDHAQHALGDIVYVELPEVGQSFEAEEDFGVVESVKAASDLYMPVDAKIVAINESLEDSPDLVNAAPYGDGWLVRVALNADGLPDDLMDADAYHDSLHG